MTRTQYGYLLQLADLLEGLNDDQLDMSIFCDWDFEPAEGVHSLHNRACALGWATTFVPGLALRRGEGLFRTVVYRPNGDDGPVSEGFQAGATAFGISLASAEHLFDTGSYEGNPSKWVVINRIRNVAERHAVWRYWLGLKVDAIRHDEWTHFTNVQHASLVATCTRTELIKTAV